MQLTILGAGSALPTLERSPTAQYLQVQDSAYLLDCAEGTQLQLRRFKLSHARIRAVFISHLHGDHYLGLMGLIWTMSLLRRRKPLTLIGPAQLQIIIRTQLDAAQAVPEFELHFIDVAACRQDSHVYQDEHITVRAFPREHRVACFGYDMKEHERPRNLIKDAITGRGLSIDRIKALKAGADVKDNEGNWIRSKDVSTPAPPPAHYVFSTDTLPLPLPEYAHEAHLLYHEATFLHELKNRATETFHTTAKEAAEIAAESDVDRLIIGHYSSRYRTTDALVNEARSVFSNTDPAEDGLVLDI